VTPDKQRPRNWLHLDVDFLNQDNIADLRDEFGPAGPLTILALITEAKRSDLGGLRTPSEQGILSIRTRALARLVGEPTNAVAAIVSRSVEMGLLECLDGTDADTGRLVVRSLKRKAWEPSDATAAARAARYRHRSATDDAPNTSRQ
jgi:hypothetical protein